MINILQYNELCISYECIIISKINHLFLVHSYLNYKIISIEYKLVRLLIKYIEYLYFITNIKSFKVSDRD